VPKKYPKLTREGRELASQFISEEVKTKKYPRKQAIAIGISRARKATSEAKHISTIRRLKSKYRIK
jgi:hypothetical protein